MQIGFHASHEQWRPSQLLAFTQAAASAGFEAAMCSDHFHPWSEREGQSGFAWSWLGTALQSTSIAFGTVCAPGQRYHPAVVAQAAATLAEMYEGRFWLAVGSGEALNESITGMLWPSPKERHTRLKESVDVMRALWAGETVSREGLIRVRNAKLYTRPDRPPLIIGAALTPETAEWMGSWADGLITVGRNAADLKIVIDACHNGGGECKPLFLQSAISFASSEAEALEQAHRRWPQCTVSGQQITDIPTPPRATGQFRGCRK